jgi:hypothetical protein
LEVPQEGRAQADQTGPKVAHPRDERRYPSWGAPRIHGEPLKLGFEVAQSTAAKYMMRRHGPPGQSWWTFMRNHAPEIAAMDLFVVPTLAFNVLYNLLILRIERRELVWIGVTTSPTADWIARQITEAFPGIQHHSISSATETARSAVVGIACALWEERPLEQIEKFSHPAFIARFGPSCQTDEICGRDRSKLHADPHASVQF